MPFAPGSIKPAGSGRKKTTQNRVTVTDILRDMKCDPIEGMARIAMDAKQPMSLRAKVYSELAQYLYPKRRAIELTGADGSPIELNVSATELLTSRIARLAERTRPDGGTGGPERSAG